MLRCRSLQFVLSSSYSSHYYYYYAVFVGVALFGSKPSNPSPPKYLEKEFHAMLHMSPLPSVVCFTQMLGQFARDKRYDVVIALFKQLGLVGISADVSTFNVLVECYCQLKQPKLGLSVLPYFIKLGLQLDVTTFSALFDAFLAQTTTNPLSSDPNLLYCLDIALDLFHKMLRLRPLPCVISFTKILGQLLKLQHYPQVISLNMMMLLRGVAPDEYTLSILIKCFCHLGRMDFSLSVFASFFKWGLEPDVVTYSTLIHGFVLDNQVPEAAL